MILEHVGRLHVLMIDRIVLLDERQRRLVVKVSPLAFDFQMWFRQQLHCPSASVTAMLASSHSPLGRPKRPLGFAVPTGMEAAHAVSESGEHFQAKIYPGLLSGRWQGLGWHISARNASVPPVRFPADGNGLGGAFQWTMDTDAKMPNLRQAEHATIEDRPSLISGTGETMVATCALKPLLQETQRVL